MTTGKTVVHINIGERKIEDVQGIDVIVTTKNNTKILYDKWYMTEQKDSVLDEIRTEIKQTVSRYSISRERGCMGQVEWSDRLIKESEILQIIDKYKAESEEV